MSAAPDSSRAVLLALGANAAIALSKYAAAALSGSSSMLAEAVHSTADCGNQLLLLLGMRRARRAPSLEYPMGFGKETYFWSFIVALMLFSMGGVFSAYEGWHKLQSTQPLANPAIALAVLAFGIAAEAFSLRGCLREVAKERGARSLWRWFRDSRNAELVVIFAEDVAALAGLALAFAAVLAAWLTGETRYDALGSIAIGVLLMAVALLVATEVKALLVGQGVEPAVRAQMIEFLESQPSVERVIDLLTLHFGNDVMVAVKAKMRPHATTSGLVEEINRIEAGLRECFPAVAWTFFEPDER
jgi:cation diffusion facilitator family transporter